jgi:hypothetical protein
MSTSTGFPAFMADRADDALLFGEVQGEPTAGRLGLHRGGRKHG